MMKKRIARWTAMIVLLCIGVIWGIKNMGNDFSPFIRWWGALFLLGIGFMPLSAFVFQRFHDKGWVFSKAIGLAVSGWLVWYLASLKFVRFTTVNCFLVFGILVILNFVFAFLVCYRCKKAGTPELNPYTLKKLGEQNYFAMFSTEVLFFLSFLLWTYLRCFKPEIFGNTEKFMDYGLMTSIYNSEYMPAQDMWLSGESINYYYLGQYLSVFLKRISGVDMKYAYNLALMMLAAFGFTMPFSLMYQVASDCVNRRKVSKKKNDAFVVERGGTFFVQIVGLLSGIVVCFAGNMHFPIVNYLALNVPFVKRLLSIERDFYWFPDATRYIGYTPDTVDKTIHEFPCYSFVLGDLHAHVLNIMFVLTVMALLYSLLQRREERMELVRKHTVDLPELTIKDLMKETVRPQILLIGFFIGFFHMTNYWDFPIYFVVSGAIILFSNAVICRFKKETWFLTGAHAIIILLISTIVCLPFTLNFEQISTGVALCGHHTPLYQLCVLWGLPIACIITYFIIQLNRLPALKSRKKGKPIQDEMRNGETRNGLFHFITSLQISDLFVITIGLCAIGLILLPEVVYVKDIYSGDYKRANTMFKLTYQAFIMFGMGMSYIIVKLLRFRERKSHLIGGLIMLLLVLSTIPYFFTAAKSWFGEYTKKENYKGLDCTNFYEEKFPEDAAAINWINNNLTGDSVVLEAAGLSYTYYQRVSVLTGHPTLLGWQTHEWLWRSGAEFEMPPVINERQQDVVALYTSNDRATVTELIDKYDIEYIYVGFCERYDGTIQSSEAKENYELNAMDNFYYLKRDVNDELLRSLGDVVYQYEDPQNGSIYDEDGEYRTYVVKVK